MIEWFVLGGVLWSVYIIFIAIILPMLLHKNKHDSKEEEDQRRR